MKKIKHYDSCFLKLLQSRFVYILLGCLLLISVTAKAANFNSVSAIFNAQATIIDPLSVKESKQLNFGKISKPVSPGTITLNPDGSKVLNGLDCVGCGAGGNDETRSIGTLSISGSNNEMVNLTITSLPDSLNGVDLTAVSGKIGDSNCASGPTSTCPPMALGGGGNVLSIGGTLMVDQNISPGPLPTGATGIQYQVNAAYQ